MEFIRNIFNWLFAFDVFIFNGDDVTDIKKHAECCLVGERTGNGTSPGWMLTGVLIHPRIVLTAGHGFFDRRNKEINLNVVALPVLSPNDVTDNTLFEIEDKKIHPQYLRNRRRREADRGNDIALLFLKKNVPQIPTPNIILKDEMQVANSKITIVGFGGSERFSRGVIESKREKEVEVLYFKSASNEDFSNEETQKGFDADSEFVAGDKRGDTCPGDSGGAAFVYTNDQKKLLGLLSRNVAGNQGDCGDGSIFTRIDTKTAWIKDTISAYGLDFNENEA